MGMGIRKNPLQVLRMTESPPSEVHTRMEKHLLSLVLPQLLPQLLPQWQVPTVTRRHLIHPMKTERHLCPACKRKRKIPMISENYPLLALMTAESSPLQANKRRGEYLKEA